MFSGDGLTRDVLCSLFLVLRKMRRSVVMKPLILWTLRFNFVTVIGKQISYSWLNSVQNISNASSTKADSDTDYQLLPCNRSLKRSMLAALNFLLVMSFCFSLGVDDENWWKFTKWSLKSVTRVPQSLSPKFLLTRMWSMSEWEWPWILVDLEITCINPFSIIEFR